MGRGNNGSEGSGGSASSPSCPSTLRGIVQSQLLNNVLLPANEKCPKNKWMVLVVDRASLRMMSSSVGMYDLMEHRVTIVEDLSKKRAPFRDQAVIYLIESTHDSVHRMIEDWTPSREKEEKGQGPPYGDTVFVYTLGRLSDELLGDIRKCKQLMKRIKALGEVNLDFLTKEADAFHFDMKESFNQIYPAPSPCPALPVHDAIMSKLATVCATLNEYPHVRFPEGSALCRSLAFTFQKIMNQFVGNNADWWYHGDGGTQPTDRGERGTLVLMDRGDDCLSPLIHEFTYEAMVNDLLGLDDDRITYEPVQDAPSKKPPAEQEEEQEGSDPQPPPSTKKDALLNDNDEIWVELRGKHIADVIQTLSSKIRNIVTSNAGSALTNSGTAKGKALSVNQMAKAMKALPEYREVMSKLSMHMQVAHQCMDQFNRQGLLDLSELEQTLATGKNDEGRAPKSKELLVNTVEQFRAAPDAAVRLRLLAILVVSQGPQKSSNIEKLMGEANLDEMEMRPLENLAKMGHPMVTNSPSEGNPEPKLSFLKRFASLADDVPDESESEYSSSRYNCPAKATMTAAAAGTLCVEAFPSVMPLPENEMLKLAQGGGGPGAKSLRKKKEGASMFSGGKNSSSLGGSSNSSSKKGGKASGGRQIFFVAGGMCYSELRAAREVAAATGKDIIVGSTRFINPIEFVKDLASLE